MSHSIEASGKTIDEAIQSALRTLQTDRDSVTVEVLEKPKTGFLGIGSAPARVRVTLLYEETSDTSLPKRESAPAKAEAKPAAAPPKPKSETAASAGPAAAPFAPKPAFEKPKTSPQAANRGDKPPRRHRDTPQEPVEESRVEEIKRFVEETLALMGLEGATVKASQEERYLLLDVSGENMGRLIGRRGETLDAVQRLVSHAANHNAGRHIRLIVDTEQYRQKREESLVTLARKSAERALRQHRNVPLEPMNSYARHVIHATLQDYPGITTHSVGSEPNRRVIIAVPGGDTRPPRTGGRKTEY